MTSPPARPGTAFPPDVHLIEVRVARLMQLFNAIDPSPFHERDLDPNAEAFIVGWARDLHRHAPLALLVHLQRSPGIRAEEEQLREAVSESFRRRAASARGRLRELLRIGRLSLGIGLLFLTLSLLAGEAIESALEGRRIGTLLRESLLIGGWVAMWRPLEILLYSWWPVLAEARLYDRLAVMPVRIAYLETEDGDAWREDWPAVSASGAKPFPTPQRHIP